MPSFLLTPIPNEEAAALIRTKPVVAQAVFRKLMPELKARAIAVVGVEHAASVQAIRDHLADVPAGADWNATRKEISGILGGAWLGESQDPDEAKRIAAAAQDRAELLLRTHVFQAEAAVQYRMLDEQRDVFPYWEYVSSRDGRVRASHAALDGLVLPCDSPFWQEHYPPWEWGCRCTVRPRTRAEVEGIRAETPERIMEGTLLRALENGAVLRDGRRIPVMPATGERAYNATPGNLRLDVKDLQARFDPEVWRAFSDWAGAQKIEGGVSVLQWLEGEEIPPAAEDVVLATAAAAPEETSAARVAFDSAKDFPQLSGFTAAARQTVATIEARLASEPVEHAALIGPDGKTLATSKGDAGSAQVPKSNAQAFHTGALTHNHPDGSPLSDQDIAVQLSRGAREVRAVDPWGGVYTMVLPTVGDSRSRAAAAHSVAAAWARLVSPLVRKRASYAEIHRAIARVADECGLRYAYVPREVPHAK